MSNYLILGANSFSGSRFIGSLLDSGHNVVALGRSPQLAKPLRIYEESNTLIFEQFSMDEKLESLRNFKHVEECEYVVNFAAQSMVSQSWDSPQDWYQTNIVDFSTLIADLYKKVEFKKFIQFTTPEVYGNTEGWIKESFDFSPSTPYAISRAASDFHLRALFENQQFPVIFTRAANVYGPGQPLYRIVPKIFMSGLMREKLELHGGGKSVRSFIEMDDVSDALMKIVERGIVGDTYHISTNQLLSISQLVEKCAEMLDVSPADLVEMGPERPGKDQAYKLDSSKLREELDWTDTVSIEHGLAQTLNWVQKNYKELLTFPRDYRHRK